MFVGFVKCQYSKKVQLSNEEKTLNWFHISNMHTTWRYKIELPLKVRKREEGISCGFEFPY